jgi:hypothetical protein
VRDRTRGHGLRLQHVEGGDAGVVLAAPASSKNTAFRGTSSANSPELAPPWEAETTMAPASAGVTLVIESMMTMLPPAPRPTSFFSISLLAETWVWGLNPLSIADT